MSRTLIVMVKVPGPGRVKTRLGRDIGAVPAAWWYRHQVARTLRALRDPRWQIVLGVSPDRAVAARFWPPDLPRIAQGRGDLGQRMARLLTRPWPGPAVLIGSDIPGLTRAHIASAFECLGRSDAVFGPAVDGGYWLIGLKGLRPPPPSFLKGVRWSTPDALSDSLTTLGSLRHRLCHTLRDMDTGADMAAFRHDPAQRS